MRELTVAMVMTKDPVTVPPDAEFGVLADVLARNSISAVPVVGRDGVPVGVVSEVDLTRVRARGTVVRADDVMTVPVRAVQASESVSFAARELNRPDVRRLFVMEHGRLVGVVSRRDLLRVFLRSDEEIQADVEREVFQRVLGTDPSTVAVTVKRGAVTVSGLVERRSDMEIAGRLIPTVPGVVEVRNRLSYVWNDQALN